MSARIKIGDVVRLRSGGPKWDVGLIPEGSNDALVVRADDDGVTSESLPLACLEVVGDEAAAAERAAVVAYLRRLADVGASDPASAWLDSAATGIESGTHIGGSDGKA